MVLKLKMCMPVGIRYVFPHVVDNSYHRLRKIIEQLKLETIKDNPTALSYLLKTNIVYMYLFDYTCVKVLHSFYIFLVTINSVMNFTEFSKTNPQQP